MKNRLLKGVGLLWSSFVAFSASIELHAVGQDVLDINGVHKKIQQTELNYEKGHHLNMDTYFGTTKITLKHKVYEMHAVGSKSHEEKKWHGVAILHPCDNHEESGKYKYVYFPD